jgi:outer membrane lipoprotein-sorting protein
LHNRVTKHIGWALCIAIGVAVNSPAQEAGGPARRSFSAGGPDLIELLRQAQKKYETVVDYTVTFHKQQRVKGTLHKKEVALYKFKKPFNVYLKWIGEIDKGSEALYAEGKHGGKLLVHLGGIINYFTPTVALHPKGALAMRKNLRPITESGLGNTIALLARVCAEAQGNGDLNVRYLGTGETGGRSVHRFERILPPGKGYPAHKTLIEIDKETSYPISVVSHGWDGELLEKYLYEDLRTNVGLTDADFDRANSAYQFGYVTVPIP